MNGHEDETRGGYGHRDRQGVGRAHGPLWVIRQRDLLRACEDLVAGCQAGLTAARVERDAVVNFDRPRALCDPRIRQGHLEGFNLTGRARVKEVEIELSGITRGQLVARHVLWIRREDQPKLIVRQRAAHRVGDEGAPGVRFRHGDDVRAGGGVAAHIRRLIGAGDGLRVASAGHIADVRHGRRAGAVVGCAAALGNELGVVARRRRHFEIGVHCYRRRAGDCRSGRIHSPRHRAGDRQSWVCTRIRDVPSSGLRTVATVAGDGAVSGSRCYQAATRLGRRRAQSRIDLNCRWITA